MKISVTVNNSVPEPLPTYTFEQFKNENVLKGVYKIFNKHNFEYINRRIVVINNDTILFVDLNGAVDTFKPYAWSGDKFVKVDEEITLKIV